MKKRSLTKRKKSKSFNPNRDFVNGAVEEFMKKGGKITKLERESENDVERFISQI